jgi:hypothetical protein
MDYRAYLLDDEGHIVDAHIFVRQATKRPLLMRINSRMASMWKSGIVRGASV